MAWESLDGHSRGPRKSLGSENSAYVERLFRVSDVMSPSSKVPSSKNAACAPRRTVIAPSIVTYGATSVSRNACAWRGFREVCAREARSGSRVFTCSPKRSRSVEMARRAPLRKILPSLGCR